MLPTVFQSNRSKANQRCRSKRAAQVENSSGAQRHDCVHWHREHTVVVPPETEQIDYHLGLGAVIVSDFQSQRLPLCR
jgi:hypothetical protein